MPNFWNKKRKALLVLAITLCGLNIVLWQDVFMLASPQYLNINVFDVGQGDSIFIKTPSMRHILIDGGISSKVLGKLQSQLPFWQKSLDVVVLTHPDADHLNGLLDVLKRYKVNYIVWTGMVRDGPAYEKWLELLEIQKRQGSIIVNAKSGLQIKNGSIVIDALHPLEDLTGKFVGKQDNDTGVVLRLAYGKKSFLFTADISIEAEKQMVAKKAPLDSDVLKVAHHGSKYSSSEEFLRSVTPEIAVISVGKDNSYGHPTHEVLQKLSEFGITTFRTDMNGDIKMLSDGENINIQ